MGFKKLALVSILFILLNYFDSFAQINMIDTTLSIDPKGTYLRIYNDPGTLDAVPLELSTLGISSGDYLILQQLGTYDNGPGGDIYDAMVGVFSANDSLLDPSQPDRVPGAIDAGDDYVSSPTWSGNFPTDVPEDFFIDSVLIQVPDSAQFIFICAHDSKYGDNSDPNNDFGVNIKTTFPPIKISDKGEGNIINNCQLYQNFPNPFNPTTTIEFSIPELEFVTLKIYNLLGEEVATLVSEKLTAGRYKYEWDAGEMTSGIYFYQLNASKITQTKKMFLLR